MKQFNFADQHQHFSKISAAIQESIDCLLDQSKLSSLQIYLLALLKMIHWNLESVQIILRDESAKLSKKLPKQSISLCEAESIDISL